MVGGEFRCFVAAIYETGEFAGMTIDEVTLEMWCRALDDFGAWIAFSLSVLGIAITIILAAVLAALVLRAVWKFLVANTVNRLIVSLERKALRQ